MTTSWNGDAAFEAIRRAAAEDLLRCAVLFQSTHMQRISKPNPPPYLDSSRPGEYARLRTGAGLRGLSYEPTTVEAVMRTGMVRLGFTTNVSYMLTLELARDRLGLLRTLQDLQPVLSKLCVASFQG